MLESGKCYEKKVRARGQGRRRGSSTKEELLENTPLIRSDGTKIWRMWGTCGSWPCGYQDKNIQDRMSFQIKVSKKELSLACLKTPEKAGVGGAEWGERWMNRKGQGGKDRSVSALWVIRRTLAFTLSKVRATEYCGQRREVTWLRCSRRPLVASRRTEQRWEREKT